MRWSNIDKVLLKVYLFAEHNNKRHNVRTCCSGAGRGATIDSPKFRELFIAGWHCTRNEVHMH